MKTVEEHIAELEASAARQLAKHQAMMKGEARNYSPAHLWAYENLMARIHELRGEEGDEP